MGLSHLPYSLAMQFLAILSCVSLALAEPSCDECLGAIDSLVARLTSDDSLAEQAAILVGALCPGAADPADCEARLPAGWAQVGQALFPEFLQGATICAVPQTLEPSSPLPCRSSQLPSPRHRLKYARILLESA